MRPLFAILHQRFFCACQHATVAGLEATCAAHRRSNDPEDSSRDALRRLLGAGRGNSICGVRMRINTLTVRITFAWWFPIYFNSVTFLAYAFDCELNMERVGYWLAKATTITIEGAMPDPQGGNE